MGSLDLEDRKLGGVLARPGKDRGWAARMSIHELGEVVDLLGLQGALIRVLGLGVLARVLGLGLGALIRGLRAQGLVIRV